MAEPEQVSAESSNPHEVFASVMEAAGKRLADAARRIAACKTNPAEVAKTAAWWWLVASIVLALCYEYWGARTGHQAERFLYSLFASGFLVLLAIVAICGTFHGWFVRDTAELRTLEKRLTDLRSASRLFPKMGWTALSEVRLLLEDIERLHATIGRDRPK